MSDLSASAPDLIAGSRRSCKRPIGRLGARSTLSLGSEALSCQTLGATVNSPSSYQLFKELLASPGMEYLNRRKLRAFTVNIFHGNFSELMKACELVENPEVGLKLMSEEHRETLGTQAHMEVMRLFHNFLAAAKSLIDHTRVFVDDHYRDTPLMQAYQQKIQADFADDPLMRFIQDLRNYMLHRALPGGSMSLSVSRNPDTNAHDMKSTVGIDKKAIETWGKWTKPSLAFLAAADDEIQISQISRAYGERVEEFAKWFDAKLQKHHEADIAAFENLQKEYQAAQREEEAPRNDT